MNGTLLPDEKAVIQHDGASAALGELPQDALQKSIGVLLVA